MYPAKALDSCNSYLRERLGSDIWVIEVTGSLRLRLSKHPSSQCSLPTAIWTSLHNTTCDHLVGSVLNGFEQLPECFVTFSSGVWNKRHARSEGLLPDV